MRYAAVQRFVSAACLPHDTVMSLVGAADSSAPLEFVNYETDYADDGEGELLCHVRGNATDIEAAAITLTNAGVRNLQLIAVAANAAILTPHQEVVYEPEPGGRFLAVRTLGADPQAARRMIDVDRTLALVEVLQAHPKETRLLRAIENYGESLRRTHPVASIHAALHLWMAVENLAHVAAERLKQDQGARKLRDLAPALDVHPRAGEAEPDDRDVLGAIRRREVFGGDVATHKALKDASDGIEHGYRSFGDARALVEGILDKAAAAIRSSILRESGLPDEDVRALLAGVYARPLPLWRPRVFVEGALGDDASVDFARPAQLRVTASLDVEQMVPETHATTATANAKVQTAAGLTHTVDRVSIESPGEARGWPQLS